MAKPVTLQRQRRHFELIADLLVRLPRTLHFDDAEGHETLAREFARRLYLTNPLFDRYRFLARARGE